MVKLKSNLTLINLVIILIFAPPIYCQKQELKNNYLNTDGEKKIPNADKFVADLLKKNRLYRTKKSDSAIFYANSVIEYGDNKNDFRIYTEGILALALTYHANNKSKIAITTLKNGITLANEKNNATSLVVLHELLGDILEKFSYKKVNISVMYEAETAFDQAILYTEKSYDINKYVQLVRKSLNIKRFLRKHDEIVKIVLNLLEKHNQNKELTDENKSKLYQILGNNYIELNNSARALTYTTKALNLNSSITTKVDNLIILGKIHEKNKDYKKALEVLNKTQELIVENNLDSPYHKIITLEKMGDLHRMNKDYHNAINYYSKVIDYTNKNYKNYKVVNGTSYYGIGQSFFDLKNFKEAKINANWAKEIYEDNKIHVIHLPWKKTQQETYFLLSRIDSAENNFRGSLKNYKLSEKAKSNYKKIIDSIYNLDKLKTIEELEISYESEKKDNKILELTATTLKEKTLRTSLFLGILFLTLLLLFLYNRAKLRKKAFVAISEKNHENKLLMQEIHHRVKNNLQIILSLLNSQANAINKNTNINTVILECQNKIKSISLIHQNLYNSNNFSEIPTRIYIPELINNLKKSYSSQIDDVDFITAIEDLKIKMSLAVPLGLILNELITNIYKYAFEDNNSKKTLTINFQLILDNEYRLEVGDNGKGIPNGFNIEESSSFGLQLVYGLVQQLNGEIKINRLNGTRYEISLIEPKAA